MALKSGDVLGGRYRIVKPVGQGGFGAVYRAWDISLKVPVAVKENLDTSAEAQRQFEHEAQLLAPLRHPNLPRVGDHFFLPDQGQYLVMDFVEGQSLDTLLAERGRPLAEAEAVAWIGQVCDALEYLHSRTPPVIHRDIKPQNIIINADGRAVLVDFGISKVYDPGLTTTRGARAVTPGFSPPEQYGMGKTDARSDVYALGATLYTLLTGAPPPESVVLMAGNEALLPIRRTNPGVSPNTENAVAAAMALASSQRLIGAGAMKAALQGQAIAPLPPVWQTATLAPAAGERKGAPGWLMALAGVVGVGLLVIGAFLLFRPEGGQEAATAEPPGTVVADGVAAAPPTDSPPFEATQAAQLPAAAAATKTPEATTTPAASPTAPAEPQATQPAQASGPGDRRVVTPPGGSVISQVFVPAGSFRMGADDEDSDTDEAPIHEVRLDAFWIDETEVTLGSYDDFVAATGYITAANRDGAGFSVRSDRFERVEGANWREPFGPDTYWLTSNNEPVTIVSWDDADAYCQWAGGRLPTEAEWEYAARGPGSLNYPWGNEFDVGQVNYCDRSCPLSWADETADDTFPFMADAGSFAGGVSWVGAYNMAGNVWEWTADWYDENYYSQSPTNNPTGPAAIPDGAKTVRGGAWSSERQGVRSSVRVPVRPENGHLDTGFRCAWD